jgi:hypothetical protein
MITDYMCIGGKMHGKIALSKYNNDNLFVHSNIEHVEITTTPPLVVNSVEVTDTIYIKRSVVANNVVYKLWLAEGLPKEEVVRLVCDLYMEK